MENNASFNFIDLQAALTNAEFVNFKSEWTSCGISTDSRTISQNNIFVALKGDNFDGHDCIQDAFNAGAIAAIVSNEWFTSNNNNSIIFNNPFIVVNNTLDALSELASFHRMKFNIPVIAVAGSNGKTSTKELISHILSQKYNVLRTYKNFNNQIGVPMMMLCFDNKTEIAVIEIGTSLPGEIAKLSDLLKPGYGIITNIGKEHLEQLIDLDQVEIEETFLFGNLLKTGGVCFVNNDDDRLRKYTKILTKYVTYGTDGKNECNYTANIIINDNLTPTIKFKIDNIEYTANMQELGYAIGTNSIAAIAVCATLGLSGQEIVKGLETYSASGLKNGYARMDLQQINQVKVLNDCYNANPSSMMLSIKTLRSYKNAKKHIAILGDMFELGEVSHTEHINILEHACQILNEVLVIGNNMQKASEEINSDKVKHFSNFESLAKYIKTKTDLSDIIFLLKGSRGMKMETVLSYL